jgi:hypothetical protein
MQSTCPSQTSPNLDDTRRDATAATEAARSATGDAVVIESDHIVVSPGLSEGVLNAAQTAFESTYFEHGGQRVHVYLRRMVILRGPTQLFNDAERPEYEQDALRGDGFDADADRDQSFHVSNGQVHGAFARMLVQLPCTYVASVHGTVVVSVEGITRTYRLAPRSDATSSATRRAVYKCDVLLQDASRFWRMMWTACIPFPRLCLQAIDLCMPCWTNVHSAGRRTEARRAGPWA